MPIKRISEQSCMSIEAFYIERTKEDNSHSIEIGNAIEEAKKYLLIAMRESGGWSTNEELKQLLKDNLLT